MIVFFYWQKIETDYFCSQFRSPSTTSSITAISKLVPTTDALGLLALNLANNINNNTNENDDDMVVDTRYFVGM